MFFGIENLEDEISICLNQFITFFIFKSAIQI
jgi:hypothetical protein